MSRASLAPGYFFGVFLECVMFGAFLPLFIAACYVQWDRFSKGRGPNRLMALTTGFFGLTVTAHLAIGLCQAVGTILHTPPGATIHLSRGPTFPADGIASFIILQIQATVTDMIVVYRIYFIYNRNVWVCIAPSIAILALVADGCGLVYQLRDPIFNGKAVEGWCIASFCLTIFNSIYTTGAISLKLWLVHREITKAGLHQEDSIMMRATKVLIESAALWTTFASMTFILGSAGSSLTHTFTAMSSPILGICFCLITVRLGQIFPVAQEEIWHTFIRTPPSRSRRSDRVSVPFPTVGVRRDVYVSDSKYLSMGPLGSQKQGCVHSSNGSIKVFRPSLPLSAPE